MPDITPEGTGPDGTDLDDNTVSDRRISGHIDPALRAATEARRAATQAEVDAASPGDTETVEHDRFEAGRTAARTAGLPGQTDTAPAGRHATNAQAPEGQGKAAERGGGQTPASADVPSRSAPAAGEPPEAALHAAEKRDPAAAAIDRVATPAPDRPAGNLRPELAQRPLLDGLGQGQPVPNPGMEAIILNAAMVPGWPAPRPFEMSRRLPADGRHQPAPTREPARPENGSTRTGRDEVAVQTYLANMGVKRSLLARIRAALRPVRQRARIMFGLAVLATQVVFTLHTVFSELDSVENDEDDVERHPGDQQRRLRG